MKKGLLLVLVLSLMIMPAISAITLNLSQDSYQPGELLQAEITGNFISFEPENILLYKGDKVHSTPVISDLTNHNNIYYYFAILPYEQGNYSIRIEDAEYVKSGSTVDDTIIQNFTILQSNKSALSINPGFILTSEDFTIDIKSVYGNLDITAKLEGSGETQTISLIEELEETISFSIDGLTEPTTLSIEDYNIPVFIIDKTPIEPEPIENKTELIFIPSALSGTVTPSYPFKIFVANSGTEEIKNIKISTESNLTLVNTESNLLEATKQYEITVIIPSGLKKGQNLEGTIIAEFGDLLDKQTITLPFNFEITEDERQIEVISETITLLSCEDLNGTLCDDDETCSISTETSTDGSCCPEEGKCKKEKKSNTGTIIGFMIIIFVIIIVFVLYYKGRKRLKPKSTNEILKEKREKYGDRMKGTESKEISGRLDRS